MSSYSVPFSTRIVSNCCWELSFVAFLYERHPGHILRKSMDCTCQAFDEKRGSCKRQRREAAITEGKKPLTTRGSGERCKLPQRSLGRSPRKRRDFEHFMPKWSTFLALVNLIFLNNQIEKASKPYRPMKKFHHIIYSV